MCLGILLALKNIEGRGNDVQQNEPKYVIMSLKRSYS
eukprot:SAG31_NODE_2759_length_5134_cov_5.037736_1_plen_37_part_00